MQLNIYVVGYWPMRRSCVQLPLRLFFGASREQRLLIEHGMAGNVGFFEASRDPRCLIAHRLEKNVGFFFAKQPTAFVTDCLL